MILLLTSSIIFFDCSSFAFPVHMLMLLLLLPTYFLMLILFPIHYCFVRGVLSDIDTDMVFYIFQTIWSFFFLNKIVFIVLETFSDIFSMKNIVLCFLKHFFVFLCIFAYFSFSVTFFHETQSKCQSKKLRLEFKTETSQRESMIQSFVKRFLLQMKQHDIFALKPAI